MRLQKLSTDDREYFAAFAHVIFTNPFSDSAERTEAWRRLSLASDLNDEIGQDFVAMAPGIGERLSSLDARAAGTFERYPDKNVTIQTTDTVTAKMLDPPRPWTYDPLVVSVRKGFATGVDVSPKIN